MVSELATKPLRIFVVWEPVLFTDWSSPSTATLGRISNTRARQFWDKERLISRSMGEHNRGSVVWDYIAVYPAGTTWKDRPPHPLYDGGPVVRVLNEALAALAQPMRGEQVQTGAK